MIDKNSDSYKAGYKAAPYILAVIGGALLIWLIIWGIGKAMPNPLTNDQIIKQTKQCQDAGMHASQVMNGLTYDVTKVICTNKEDK